MTATKETVTDVGHHLLYIYTQQTTPKQTWHIMSDVEMDNILQGEVKAKIKISPVVVFGVLSRMVLVRGS